MKKIFSILILLLNFSVLGMEEKKVTSQESWKIKKTIKHDKYIKKATYNTFSDQLVIVDDEKAVLTNTSNKESIILPHSSSWKPHLDPKGQNILTCPDGKSINLSNVYGKIITNIPYSPQRHPRIVKFNLLGDQILTADETVELKNLEGTLITSCKPDSEYYSVSIAEFFPNNNNLIFIVPFSFALASHKAKIWDIRNKNLITCNDIDPLKQASIHPEGNYIAGIRCADGGVAYLYDVRNNNHIYLSNFNHPRSAKFNSSGTHILTQYYLAYLALLWETQTITKNFDTQKHPNPIHKFNPNLSSATFNPAGNHILTRSTANIFSNENNIIIWNLAKNQLAKLPHEKKLYSAHYETDNYIITKQENNIITLWKKSK